MKFTGSFVGVITAVTPQTRTVTDNVIQPVITGHGIVNNVVPQPRTTTFIEMRMDGGTFSIWGSDVRVNLVVDVNMPLEDAVKYSIWDVTDVSGNGIVSIGTSGGGIYHMTVDIANGTVSPYKSRSKLK